MPLLYLLGLVTRPQLCPVKWLIQRPLVSWCCWSCWCHSKCLWACSMSLLCSWCWNSRSGPRWMCHLCVLWSGSSLLQQEAGLVMVTWAPAGGGQATGSPVWPQSCALTQGSLQMAHLLLQADGLPQLVQKCELKRSPWCIINGKNEEIHKNCLLW